MGRLQLVEEAMTEMHTILGYMIYGGEVDKARECFERLTEIMDRFALIKDRHAEKIRRIMATRDDSGEVE